jgi:hypothetical protein
MLSQGAASKERSSIGKLKGSHALQNRKQALVGHSAVGTHSRGSNKRSFNVMTTRGSASKAFKFGDGRLIE